jgi:hypothetical protein
MVYTKAMIWTLFLSKKNSTSMTYAVASNRETGSKPMSQKRDVGHPGLFK